MTFRPTSDSMEETGRGGKFTAGKRAGYSCCGSNRMLRAMVFIDFENFGISKYRYYKKTALDTAQTLAAQNGQPLPQTAPFRNPKLDFTLLPKKIVELLPSPHVLVKTFFFAPKPDAFLMADPQRVNAYNWINGMKNQDNFTVVEGTHSARPVAGFTYQTMSLGNPSSYYVEEKGTDVNIAAHLITKGLLNSYDTAVVVSGDTDYIPVMDILNTIGKTIAVVGVKGQNLFQFRQHSDTQLLLDESFFKQCVL